MRNTLYNKRRLFSVGVGVALLVLGGLSVFLIEQIVHKILGAEPGYLTLFILFVLFIIPFGFFTDYALRSAGTILGSSVRMTLAEREPARRFLITGYSPTPTDDLAQTCVDVANELNFDTIALDKEAYEGKPVIGAWQQTARAAYHNRSRLEAIYILRPDRNDRQYALFESFLEACFRESDCKPDIVQITMKDDENSQFEMSGRTGESEPPNFEDYDYVYEGLRRGREMILPRLGSSGESGEDEICIDVTPGFKPYSIAAAILTLNLRMKFSYVGTNGRVRFYDADVSFAR